MRDAGTGPFGSLKRVLRSLARRPSSPRAPGDAAAATDETGPDDGAELAADLSFPAERAAGTAERAALVKRRPESLEQRYLLMEDADEADLAFRRLQETVWHAIERRGRAGATIFREAGRLAPGRLYFYVKPAGQQGYLVERSGAGWLITGAEKIVARDLFLREQESVDAASLFAARGAVLPRVKARAAGDALLAFSVYEQRLLAQLGLA